MQTGRTARLLAMLMLLKSKEWVSAADIAARFNVSLRTVYRDIEALQSYGIQVIGVPGPDGGYRLGRDQAIEPLLFSSNQAAGLALLGSANVDMPPAMQRSTDTLVERVQELMPPREARLIQNARERVYFDTSDWYWTDEGVTWLADIRECALTSRTAAMKYRVRRNPEPRSANVEPLGLVWKAGQWYVVFRDRATARIERARLSNILAFTSTNQRFAYPTGFDLREWWTRELTAFGAGTTEVVLVGHSDARDELLRLRRKESTIVEERDGDVVVHLFVDDWTWLVPLVLSYGDSVHVDAPGELRAAVVDAAERLIHSYEDSMHRKRRPPFDDSRLRATRGRTPER